MLRTEMIVHIIGGRSRSLQIEQIYIWKRRWILMRLTTRATPIREVVPFVATENSLSKAASHSSSVSRKILLKCLLTCWKKNLRAWHLGMLWIGVLVECVPNIIQRQSNNCLSLMMWGFQRIWHLLVVIRCPT